MDNGPKLIDHGFGPKRPPDDKPLQFKRGTSKAFWIKNPLLLPGQPAVELDTYKLKIGDGKNRYNSLPYIGEGKDGKSAYQIWRDQGYSGTIDDFLQFCVGPAGKSAYEIWLSLGHEGTITDFITSLQGKDGADGKSAYDIWIDAGHEGTITDFLESLHGKSAYEIWLSLGHEGTESDFIDSLKGEKGDQGDDAFEVWKRAMGLPEATIDDFLDYLCSESWGNINTEESSGEE